MNPSELQSIPSPPHTDEERRIMRLAAIAESRHLHAELLALRKGKLFDSSVDLIREAREEREHEPPFGASGLTED